jgi:hypothetical protein
MFADSTARHNHKTVRSSGVPNCIPGRRTLPAKFVMPAAAIAAILKEETVCLDNLHIVLRKNPLVDCSPASKRWLPGQTSDEA